MKLFIMVCPFEGFENMVVKAIKTQEMCKAMISKSVSF